MGPKSQQLFMTHYIEAGGDLVLDSEMVFNVNKNGILTLAETAVQNPLRGGESRGRDAKFAGAFARNLVEQGFGEVTYSAEGGGGEDGGAVTNGSTETDENTVPESVKTLQAIVDGQLDDVSADDVFEMIEQASEALERDGLTSQYGELVGAASERYVELDARQEGD